LPAPVGIVTLKRRTISPVAQLVIEYARKVAKPLAKQATECLLMADIVAKVAKRAL
jgi:hypothetical protein